jgi:hypothetical protein
VSPPAALDQHADNRAGFVLIFKPSLVLKIAFNS